MYPKAVANGPDRVVSIVNFNAIPAVRGESQRRVGLVARLRAFAVGEKDNASAERARYGGQTPLWYSSTRQRISLLGPLC
jgi:hypothetical protein